MGQAAVVSDTGEGKPVQLPAQVSDDGEEKPVQLPGIFHAVPSFVFYNAFVIFYYLFYCSQVLSLIMLLLLYHYSFYLLLVLTVARDTEDEDVLTARSAQGM